jgi:hypothetical protein
MMKRTLTLLIASMFIIGCSIPDSTKIEPFECKITSVQYKGNNICEYGYIVNGGQYSYFKDNCNKYSVGDTITFKK